MDKFLYFRTVDSVSADVAATGDSYCINANKLVGFTPNSGTELIVLFTPFFPHTSDGDNDNFANNDTIILNVNNHMHANVIRAIVEEIAYGRNPFIVIADDAGAGGDSYISEGTRYIHPAITSCGAFSMASSFN